MILGWEGIEEKSVDARAIFSAKNQSPNVEEGAGCC